MTLISGPNEAPALTEVDTSSPSSGTSGSGTTDSGIMALDASRTTATACFISFEADSMRGWMMYRLGSETTGADSAQVLKRRLSLMELQKARAENKQKSDDGSKGSVDSAESRNARGVPLAVAGGTLDPELGLLVAAAGFSIGMDSEDSEDRSSKSSMAASAPRLRHDALGFGKEKGRVKNFGGRGSGNVLQRRGQEGRGGGLDISKKFRGDQVRIEKENSHSSVDSDLRSSNAAFMRRGSVGGINGKKEPNFKSF